MYYNLADIVG